MNRAASESAFRPGPNFKVSESERRLIVLLAVFELVLIAAVVILIAIRRP